MAITKAIKKDNGVTLSYHRIALVNVEVNQQITILVESYIDSVGRQYEKDYAKGLIKDKPTFPYTQADYMHIPYDETLDLFTGNIVEKAYAWLKTQPDFIGSQDV